MMKKMAFSEREGVLPVVLPVVLSEVLSEVLPSVLPVPPQRKAAGRRRYGSSVWVSNLQRDCVREDGELSKTVTCQSGPCGK